MKQSISKATVVFDIRSEIDSEIRQGAVDPYKIAKKLAAKVPPHVALEFVELHIVTLARSMFSGNRIRSFTKEVEDGGRVVSVWDNDRWTNGRVQVPGNGYVRYRDLTKDDCERIAVDRESRADGMKKESTRFRLLAAAIVKYAVKKAGELTEAVRMACMK